MNQQNNSKAFDFLGQILKVDAPSFLFAKIQQRIATTNSSNFSLRLSWAIGISIILLITINISLIKNHVNQSQQDVSIIKTMNLMPQNYLYQ